MREGWEIHRFDEVFDLQMGKTPDRKEPKYFEGSNVWVSIRDIDGKEISDSNEHISDEAIKISNIRKVKKGTVIMSFKLTVGKCAIATKDLYTNEAIMAFNLQKGFDITPDFLYYYLSSYKWEGANKAVMGFTLNKATISQNKISFPPLSVQQSIVSELDMLSGLIAKHEEQLKAYDELAQSIFFDMFGDPVENEKGWEVKKLGEVAKEKLSYGSGASAKQYDGKVRYVRITDIKDDGELNTDMVSPDTYDEKYLLNEGDILFARSGATVGKTFQYKGKYGKCIYAGYLIRLVPNTELVLPSYVFGYTKSPYYRSFVAMAQNAVAQPNINAKQYSDLLLPLPPLSLQTLFAEKIEAIERQKGLVQQSIAEVQTLFDSRMDYYFNSDTPLPL